MRQNTKFSHRPLISIFDKVSPPFGSFFREILNSPPSLFRASSHIGFTPSRNKHTPSTTSHRFPASISNLAKAVNFQGRHARPCYSFSSVILSSKKKRSVMYLWGKLFHTWANSAREENFTTEFKPASYLSLATATLVR